MSLYGCALCDFSCKSIFFNSWRIALRMALDLDRDGDGTYLPVLVDGIPVEEQLHKRFIKFMNSLQKLDNNLTACVALAFNGSRSNVSRSFNHIKKK